MFGRLLAFGLLILGACAQPKYVQETPIVENRLATQDGNSTTDSKADCSVKMSASGLCLKWAWNPKPTAKQAGVIVFKLFRLNQMDQTPVEVDPSGTPEVVLWMPAMGHGSTPTHTDRIDVGTFRTNNVFFVMPGKWEIRFEVKEGDNLKESATVETTF